MCGLADVLLTQGHNVVLDSPSFFAAIPARGVELADGHKVEYVFLECECPMEEVRTRIANRARMTSQDGEATAKPSVRPERGLALTVDTAGVIESSVSEVLLLLGVRADSADSRR